MKPLLICAVALAMHAPLFAAVEAAQPATRPATLTDLADVTTELSSVTSRINRSDRSVWEYWCGRAAYKVAVVVVYTPNGQFAIPLANVKAIRAKEVVEVPRWELKLGVWSESKTLRDKRVNTHEIAYAWGGKDRSVTGKIEDAKFQGKTEFGVVDIASASVLTLQWATNADSVPAAIREGLARDKQNVKARLVLNDGTEILAEHLQRHSSYDNFYTDFRFLRGQTATVVNFDKMKSLEFKDGDVVVTLKTGATLPGKQYPPDSNSDLLATEFTGISENGPFAIYPKGIKQIVFESAGDAKATSRPADGRSP